MARNYHVFDLVILGGGPAGRAALREALQITQNVVLISPEGNEGIYAHHLLARLWQMGMCKHHADTWAEVSLPDAQALWKDMKAESQRLRTEKEAQFLPYRHYGIRGKAKFVSPSAVRVDDGRLLHFTSAVVATGEEGVNTRFPEHIWKTLSQWKPLVIEAQIPEQVSFGVLCALLGAEVEIRGSSPAFDISRESFTQWKTLLPASCQWREEERGEKNRLSRLPAGMGLRAGGISKAAWLEREQGSFHIGTSPVFVAGTARGEGKDAFACAEEGRLAVREALLQEKAMAFVPQRQFMLHGALSLMVYGAALQNIPENVTERVAQSASITGGAEDFHLKLWQEREGARPVRVEILAHDPFFPLFYLKEWMRTGERLPLSGEWLEKYPVLRAL